jgi:polar amino acid transport system substrate-binding protein
MKTFVSILLFAVGFSLQIHAQNQKLKLASDVWPPFTNVKGEESIALNLVKTALERVDIETEIEISDFDKVIKEIESNTTDGTAAIWKTQEREKTLLFSAPYLQNQLILVGLKGTDVTAKTIDALTGKKIGVVKNYAYGDKLLHAKNITLIFSESDQTNLEKLFDKKVDYMLVDKLLINYLLKYELNNVQELLAIANKPFETKMLYFALNKNVPDADIIISKFNDEIKLMVKDGTYNEILHINWIEADINDDGVTELVHTGNEVGVEPPTNPYSLFHGINSGEQQGYYFNGTFYKNWNEVPRKYKNYIPIESSNDINNPGLHLNIE